MVWFIVPNLVKQSSLLERLSTDDKSHHRQARVNMCISPGFDGLNSSECDGKSFFFWFQDFTYNGPINSETQTQRLIKAKHEEKMVY